MAPSERSGEGSEAGNQQKITSGKLTFRWLFFVGFAGLCPAFSISERGHAVCSAYRWKYSNLTHKSIYARRTHYRARPCCIV